MRVERHQQRGSVRCAFRDLRGPDRAGRARLVLHNHDAVEPRLQRRLQHPRQRVGRAARRERHHQRHGRCLCPSWCTWRRNGQRRRAREHAASRDLHRHLSPIPPRFCWRRASSQSPSLASVLRLGGLENVKHAGALRTGAHGVRTYLPGVRQKSPFFTSISSLPCTRIADPSSSTPHCSSG